MKNINKGELIDAVAAKTDMSKKDVSSVLEATLDKVTEEIRKGNYNYKGIRGKQPICIKSCSTYADKKNNVQ